MSAGPPVISARPGTFDRLLRPFADVRAGEGVTALLLMLNVFLLLGSYYLIKTIREPLILAGGGAELKSYSAAGQALLLLGLVPLYGALAGRVDRIRLITWVTLFFASNLVVFFFLAQAKTPYLGVGFFLWVGIFNLMIVAQFWSFANDVYSPQQGKRLFAIVGFGSTTGAIAGAWAAKPLIAAFGVYPLTLIAAGILLACVVLTRVVGARERAGRAARGSEAEEPAPLGGPNGFTLVFSSRYLVLIALLMVVLNVVNTNGEYILSKMTTLEAARRLAEGAAGGADSREWTERFIGVVYADFYFWVNLASASIQLLLVSRLLKWLGVRGALFILPAIAFTGYSLLVLAPMLSTALTVKIAENSTDYSIQNTTRQALFLPTSREVKYKAKAAIDSFFWRSGDLLSSALVFAGAQLALPPQRFAVMNLVLAAVWLVVVLLLAREHRRVSPEP